MSKIFIGLTHPSQIVLFLLSLPVDQKVFSFFWAWQKSFQPVSAAVDYFYSKWGKHSFIFSQPVVSQPWKTPQTPTTRIFPVTGPDLINPNHCTMQLSLCKVGNWGFRPDSHHMSTASAGLPQSNSIQSNYFRPGWHNLRGVLTSWVDLEFGPQNAYFEILATFASKMPKAEFLEAKKGRF